MLKNSKAAVLICGGASAAVTIIFYMLAFNNIFTIPMRWISLVFLILAEGIGTLKALNIRKSIFGISNIVTSIVHLGFVLVISLIFVNILPLFIKSYILINVLALCVLLVIDVIIIHFGEYVSSSNKTLAESQSVIDALCNKTLELSVVYKETAYKKDLDEIYEMLKYSDNSALSDDEITILNKLDELGEMLANNDEQTPQKITDIKNTVKLRTIKIKSSKRGSY